MNGRRVLVTGITGQDGGYMAAQLLAEGCEVHGLVHHLDPTVDAFTPVYSPSYKTATVTLGYTFRLKERRHLSVQLRVANVLDDDTPIYTSPTVQRPPGGDYVHTAARVATPFNFRYQTPRSYSLTTTFTF